MRLVLIAFCWVALISVAGTGSAAAQTRNLLETTEQARQRHSAERWNQYQQHGNRAPLGGYRERLGDPAPYGTERPGYTSPQPRGYGSNSSTWGGNRPQDRWGTR